MVYTTKSIVEEFNAYTGYTQSDEITIYLPALENPTFKHIYNGRVQKISSLMAAFASIKFNEKLQELAKKDKEEKGESILVEKLFKGYLDARTYGVDSEDEVVNSFLWRVRDAERNSKNAFAHYIVKQRDRGGMANPLHKKSSNEQIAFIQKVFKIDWNELEDVYKYGTFVKREKYWKDTEFGKVERSRVESFSIQEKDFQSIKEMVLPKYIS